MKITFLMGAGCEGKGQIGLSSGAEFQKETLLARRSKELANILNNNMSLINGIFLTWNSYSVLYQTIIKKGSPDNFGWSEEHTKIANEYLDYRKDEKVEDKESICNSFLNMYKKEIYDKLKDHDIAEKDYGEVLKFFLENGCFYSFADSLFNYLSEPEKYKNEVNKVVKLYYSAFGCMLSDLERICDFSLKNEDMKDCSLSDRRRSFCNHIDELQKQIVDELKASGKKLYYNTIRELFGKRINDCVSVVTTNYTNFSKEIIGLEDSNISYVHGKLDLFESLKTKQIGQMDEFEEDDTIIPFIFVQSGIKPIVNAEQINELSKAVNMLITADYVVVLGYGVNSDDEHIVNILRKRIREKKRILYFIHCEYVDEEKQKQYIKQKKKEINELLFCENDMVEYYSDQCFEEIVKRIKGESEGEL
ncbi:hypothetical protein [Eubacterium xylanophilum]|uniref:hypothetical protein n=1 Tax=Eubacterium xylanophilum TaxID=39497 RepID=UPI00047AD2C9|nr:hypothetical protein [Eubacterium xylanophilum]